MDVAVHLQFVLCASEGFEKSERGETIGNQCVSLLNVGCDTIDKARLLM